MKYPHTDNHLALTRSLWLTRKYPATWRLWCACGAVALVEVAHDQTTITCPYCGIESIIERENHE